MQMILKLYKSDAEHVSATKFTQDMIYGYSLLNNIVLKVKLSITIEVDKQGAIDFKKTGVLEEEHIMLRYISIL